MGYSDSESNPSLVVGSLDELRSLPIAALLGTGSPAGTPGEHASVAGVDYILDPTSLAPDDGVNVIAARPAIVTFVPLLVNPLTPGRWILASGGGGGKPFSRTFYCDPLTATPPAQQDGSDEKPFSTIMAAVTAAIPFGGNCSIILTAGDYLESVVIPPGTVLFNNVTILGQGNEVTRIIPPAGQPGFAWAPTGPASPCTDFRIQGLRILASAGAYAVDLDGTNVVGAFFGGLSVPTFNSSGCSFEDVLLQGLRLVRTGVVQLWDSNVAQQPDGSVVQFAFLRNTLITIAKATYFTFTGGGPGQVFVQHDDPAVTRYASLGMTAGTQILAELVLQGFPLVLILQGSFTQGDVTATVTPDAAQPFGFFCAGQLGFPGLPTVNTFVLPPSPVGGPPQIVLPNAIVWGSIDITHDVGADSPVVDFRDAVFMSGAPNSIKVTDLAGSGMFTDLRGANFSGKSLFAGPTAAAALRNRLVFPNFPLAGPAEPLAIAPPFPAGTRYAVSSNPSGATPFFTWVDLASHTPAGFVLSSAAPAYPDNADVVVSVSATNP
jgi:hypothetical protein